jgi:UDP-N-acetylmuramoyl-tripeptide--D-alanyl-D-alanine ligase
MPSTSGTVADNSFAASFSAQQVREIISPVETVGASQAGPGAVSTDTRSLRPGQWYLALKGETFDGHQFIANAIKGGASGCIVSSLPTALEVPAGVVVYRVPDTLVAYHQIAKAWLKQVNPFVIGVTGSSGKTTTKEMCASVVSAVASHKSQANENNEFGLPKTILSMPPGTKVLVAEMAMRGLGQIAVLAETAQPHCGIITGVGTAHIELLGSVENIIKAKCELFEHLRKDGIAIIGNPQDAVVARAKEVFKGKIELFSSKNVVESDVSIDQTKFRVDGFQSEFVVHAHGVRHVQDAWCAIVAGRAAGLSGEDIAQGLLQYRSVEGRGNRSTLPGGTVLIDESYNANPDSVRCAVEAVLDDRALPQKRKYIVLGEMAELGDNSELMHKQTGEWLRDKKFTMLITVGPKASVIAKGATGGDFAITECDTQDEALKVIRPELTADTCVMIKGSHCANLDSLVGKLSKL